MTCSLPKTLLWLIMPCMLLVFHRNPAELQIYVCNQEDKGFIQIISYYNFPLVQSLVSQSSTSSPLVCSASLFRNYFGYVQLFSFQGLYSENAVSFLFFFSPCLSSWNMAFVFMERSSASRSCCTSTDYWNCEAVHGKSASIVHRFCNDPITSFVFPVWSALNWIITVH